LTWSENVIVPAPREIWEQLEQEDQDCLPTQSRAWIDMLCAVGGWEDASRFYEWAEGQHIIVPMVRTKQPWMGPISLVPVVRTKLPLPGFRSLATVLGLGFLASHPLRSETLQVVLDDILAERSFRTLIKPNPKHISLQTMVPKAYTSLPKRTHILDLSGGFSEVWSKRFDSNTRRHIRKAERSGVKIECDRKLIPIFHDLYIRSVQRWQMQAGRPVSVAHAIKRHPLEKFTAIAKILDDNCRTWVAWHQGAPAAAIIVLQGAHHAQYAWGAMDKGVAAPIYANDLLHRLAIEDACTSGLRTYDMGFSGGNKNLMRFKARFGAAEVRFCFYSHERFPFSTMVDTLRRALNVAPIIRKIAPTGI
jgi:hypothetical protein